MKTATQSQVRSINDFLKPTHLISAKVSLLKLSLADQSSASWSLQDTISGPKHSEANRTGHAITTKCIYGVFVDQERHI
jgi:hypothetical protein